MTKDEMKNRISLALKDPILQQGFEIICKNLETEQKLNAEIKARFVKCNTCTDEMKSKCLMFSENLCEGERCEELVDLMALVNKSDLQKENAELKKQLGMSNKVYNDNLDYSHHIEDQLTKAKDILRRLMENQPTPSSMYEEADLVGWREVYKEAELFLNSEVEK